MTIAPGARIGPYDVVGPLGSGGMGDVFRARDPRLGRDVALKTLPSLASTDSERLGRFRREAQILGGLNHPHIAAVYGLEEADGVQVLVLELVEGGTLADRIAAGPLPLREAMTLARQVADALDAAHEKGIVHRDLKPANIALTREGQAKVLDFGVARTLAPGSDAATAEHPSTREGIVLGTAAYMSPEQTRGLPVDRRTDVWAFGCVLYEMLTGRRPFEGQTVSDIVVAVLGREPDWTALPESVPPRVHWLVRRCLEKDLKRRLHDIADARIELDDVLAGDSGSIWAVSAAPSLRGTHKSARVTWLVAAICLVALAGMLVAAFRGAFTSAEDDPRIYRSSIVLPDQLRLTALDPGGRFSLSPDGRHLALVASDASGQSMLWIRALDGVVPQPLAGTEGASYPFWSPDSRHLAFIERPSDQQVGSRGRLKRISMAGGAVTTLCDVGFVATGAWSPEDVILFTPEGNAPLHRVSATSGTPSPLTTLDQTSGEAARRGPDDQRGGDRHPAGAAAGSPDRDAPDPGRRAVPGEGRVHVEVPGAGVRRDPHPRVVQLGRGQLAGRPEHRPAAAG